MPLYEHVFLARQDVSQTQVEALTKEYNDKFGDKDVDELSTAEKGEMDSLLGLIEIEQKEVEKLQAEQQAALAKFTQMVEQTKQKLGVK